MSGLPKYSTGGTIHVIINNQVSFTTNPVDARPDDVSLLFFDCFLIFLFIISRLDTN